ncbi:14714_t:CDS:2 [Acaulospora colombiana]|uniref:14714_t:CDS:1 n=1 Tax=Acaulospora colombiana TaxID=27376 RepID=A0ACA9NDI3_9GLOM|nr:14714_t:CDS:2 [Acaulospora colombiana]
MATTRLANTPFKTEYAVKMTCDSCVESVRNVLTKVPGINHFEIDLQEQRVVIEGTAPPSLVSRRLKETGMTVIVRGQGVIRGSHGGAAVCIFESFTYTPLNKDDPAPQVKPQGLARMVQIDDNNCLIDVTVQGISPGYHGIHIQELGDISAGPSSTGGHYNPENVEHGDLEKGHVGDLGNIFVDENGWGDLVVESSRIKVWDVIGRSMVITHGKDDAGKGDNEQSKIDAHISANATPKFSIVALKNSSKQLLSTSDYAPLDLSDWKTTLQTHGAPSDLSTFVDYLSKSPTPAVIIDNTSSQEIASQYPLFLKKRLHVVTPNKKAFSGDFDYYKKIFEEAARQKRWLLHESTVGAGLPVINTLNDLIRTGDKIVKIEGIFSGTLSYIFNEFSSLSDGAKKKFSEIVRVAQENGYTEPDPRDDLNGLDVARKVVILGRIAGLDLDLDSLPVENIVPESLRALPSSTEFMERLSEFDHHFENLNQTAKSNDQVLRYIGVIDPVHNEKSVKLVSLPSSHPFASLKGSDNIISFTTQRFPNPLIIQGAGAGAAVTAFGIFSDLLKIYDSSDS